MYLIASGYYIHITPHSRTGIITLKDDPIQPPPSIPIGPTLAFRLHAFKERHWKLDDPRATCELYQPKHWQLISDRRLAAASGNNPEKRWLEDAKRVQEHAKSIGTRIPSDREAFMMARLAFTALGCVSRCEQSAASS